MTLLKYIILGIIQGITEPLPISSSGHIYIFRHLFSVDIFNDFNFEIFVNFASFIAIFIIFRKDVFKLIKGFFEYIFKRTKKSYNDFKYCLMIIIGTIPVGILGIVLKDYLESFLFDRVYLVGIAFILTALLLLFVKNSKGKKEDYDITYKDAIIIGLLEAVALVPGISRSGTVLAACLLCSLSKDASLKYTFMLYFPVSIATMLLGVKDIIEVGINSSMLGYYLVGMVFSGIVTYFTYKVLSNIVRNGKLWKFSIYLIIVGILTLIYFL